MSASNTLGGLPDSPPSPGRPDWDEYFLRLAELAATRATCLRRRVGAVLVAERRVLATGYNGAPKGLPHCLDVGCLRADLGIPSGQRHEICRGIHAEQNAILQAAQHGVAVRGATLYCTNQPCAICAKLLLNLDVSRMVLRTGYPDELAVKLFFEAGFIYEENDTSSVWLRG
ncbi:cytidine/deoxycytidylate deaminase family protein [Deltaproteobacteria bacterium OttesenSCG-928-M10]|nr:cytidine/deoxycytidylate deaminase family protein [Deltaproteobacteria bacterium OttesenSCG-928-M10]